MRKIPYLWKERLARLMQFTLLKRLMVWGIQLFAPRHRIGVGVVVLDASNRVLMLRHVFHPDVPWGLPGGWLEHKEDPSAGALRELWEETGLTAKIVAPVDVGYENKPHHIGITYLAVAEPGPITLSAEILEAFWFSFDDLPSPLFPGVRRAITTAVSRHNEMRILL